MKRRHHKKRRRNKSNKKDSSKKVFKKEGVEIILDGKNVIFKGTRTKEEHEKFIQRVKENRPQVLEKLSALVDQVVKTFETYDKIKLIGGLSFLHFIKQFDPQDDGISETTLEYGLSIATAISGNQNKEPSIGIVRKLHADLISIRHGYNSYMMSETATGKYSQLESGLRFKTIVEALYMRGDGYLKHIKEIYIELFDGHNEFLSKTYGFTSNDILDSIEQLEDSFCCRLILPNRIPHPASYDRFKEWSLTKTADQIKESGKHFITLFGEENPDIVVENAKIIGYLNSDITSYPLLYKVRFRTQKTVDIVRHLSCTFGENAGFLNPAYKGLPLNESLITLKPFLNFNNDFYHFAFALPFRNLISLTENLIKQADLDYHNNKYLGNTFSLSRDNFLEKKVELLFRKIINGDFYPNVKYSFTDNTTGAVIETELDLLIISETANYLVEMKAGGLSSPAKRGALKSLTSGLKDMVGYGAYQNFRAYKYIRDTDSPEFIKSDKNNVIVDKQKPLHRITVTLEHLSDLIAYQYDLKELGVIESGVEFAWTISLLDLIVFTDILESEEDLLEYIQKRVKLYEDPKFHFHDEVDVLGYYLEHNLIFDEKILSQMTHFQLNKYSLAIDEYFEKDGPKPKRKKSV